MKCDDSISDEQLMKLTAEGDEEAFAELVERYQNMVYGTIVKMLGDRTEAEDLAQLVFVRVYEHAKSYQPTARFKTWIYHILRNLVFNETRRRGRHRLESLDQLASEREEGYEIADEKTLLAREDLLKRERIEQINAVIQELPEQQREALILWRYQEMSYEEIGEAMGASVASVKSLLFRARETLKGKLTNLTSDSGK